MYPRFVLIIASLVTVTASAQDAGVIGVLRRAGEPALMPTDGELTYDGLPPHGHGVGLASPSTPPRPRLPIAYVDALFSLRASAPPRGAIPTRVLSRELRDALVLARAASRFEGRPPTTLSPLTRWLMRSLLCATAPV